MANLGPNSTLTSEELAALCSSIAELGQELAVDASEFGAVSRKITGVPLKAISDAKEVIVRFQNTIRNAINTAKKMGPVVPGGVAAGTIAAVQKKTKKS